MQKVISINLNGNAYQVEEGGYDALVAYLDAARRQLRDNPDRDEIIADLEQAIAEKCQRHLSAHKTVVAAAEVDGIVKEMGAVDAAEEPPASGGSNQQHQTRAAASPPRRLYRIPDGAMLAGVCNGIGAYVHVDPTILRVIFVGLLFLTRGGFALVYLVLAVVLPQANTSEERAAAYGEPFNAREVIDRAKKAYARHTRDGMWRWAWPGVRRASRMEWRQRIRTARRERRNWRWSGAMVYGPPAGYTTRIAAGVMVPVLTLLSVALFWLMLFAVTSLITEQQFLGVTLPDDIPLWAGIIGLVVIYQAIAWPIHMLRRTTYYTIGGAHYGTVAAFDGLLSLTFVGVGIWAAYYYLPAVREVLQQIPGVVKSLADSFQ